MPGLSARQIYVMNKKYEKRKCKKRIRTFVLPFSFIIALAFGGSVVKAGNAFADITVNPNEVIIQDGGESISAFPFLSKVGDDLWCEFSMGLDEAGEPPLPGEPAAGSNFMKKSSDGGNTWTTVTGPADWVPLSFTKLSNNDVFGINFATRRIDERHAYIFSWKSSDNGATWTKISGTITYPQDQKVMSPASNGSFLFHRTVMQMPDGSICASIYGRYANDAKYRTMWIKSTDGGSTWSVVSTIAYSSSIGTEGFCEPVIERCADGSLLAVLRIGSNLPLYQCRSTDNGLSWSTPVQIPGISSSDAQSVSPDMVLMSNGILALSYGRTGMRMAFSYDGSGYNWSDVITTYTELCSGYTALRQVGKNRVLIVGDRGANWQYPKDYEIWGKFVDIVPENAQDKDTFENEVLGQLPGGYTLLGTNAAVSNTHAYSGANSLRLYDTSATTQAKVKKVSSASAAKVFGFKVYPVDATNGIAFTLCGNSSGAVIHTVIASDGSFKYYNGSSWIPMTGAGSVEFNAWNDVRIVAADTSGARVYLNGEYIGKTGIWNSSSLIDYMMFSSGSTKGTGDDFYIDDVVFASKISAPEDTFENEPVGVVPKNYTPVNGLVLTAADQAQGSRSLKISDSITTAQAKIKKTGSNATGKIFEFKVYPVNIPNGALFTITNADGSISVFHVGIFNNGDLKWYNGSSWIILSSAGSVPFNQWSTIHIDAYDTSNAKVYLNGVLAGAAGKWSTASSMDSILIASGSSVGTGDVFYVDDVLFADK